MSSLSQKPAVPKHSLSLLVIFPVFLIASILCVGSLIFAVASRTIGDWVSYWATAKLFLQHANPYDAHAVVRLERSIGLPLPTHVLMARNPPTILWVIASLGAIPARAAGVLWPLLQATLLLTSVHLLWARYKSEGEGDGWHRMALLFAPCIICVSSGQSTMFVLLGLSFFLRFGEDRPVLSGVALSLCTFKPHLLLPFWVVLFGWIIVRRHYRLLAAFVASIALELGFALLRDHSVFSQYLAGMRADGIEDHFMPALAVVLRFVVSRHAMWLSFLPGFAGCIWAVWYFARRHHAWDWIREAPLLLLVSLLVAPYAWPFDAVIAVPAIVAAAPRVSERARTVLLALMTIALLQHYFVTDFASIWQLWQSPGWLAWYLLSTRRHTSAPADAWEAPGKNGVADGVVAVDRIELSTYGL